MISRVARYLVRILRSRRNLLARVLHRVLLQLHAKKIHDSDERYLDVILDAMASPFTEGVKVLLCSSDSMKQAQSEPHMMLEPTFDTLARLKNGNLTSHDLTERPSNREENEIAKLRWIEALIWLNFHVCFTSCYAPRLLLFIPSSPPCKTFQFSVA